MNAAITLSQMREYELATEFLKAARRIRSVPEVESRLAAVSRMKRSDQFQYELDDPRSVVQRFLFEVFAGNLNEAHLRAPVRQARDLSTLDDTQRKRRPGA
jgi:hypothetical protein